MAGELSCKKQQSCFAKIYLRMLQAILQYCNGQKYNANETRISGQIKFTYAKIGFCFKNCSGPLREKIVLAIEKNFCKFEAEHCKCFPHRKCGESPCRKVFPVISM